MVGGGGHGVSRREGVWSQVSDDNLMNLGI